MKGIILAGGSGTRLFPLTLVVSKQLLPVYNKPMIYYPLSVLMMAGIRDILIISTSTDTPKMENLLGDGKKFGIKLDYLVQPSPDGLAQAFVLGEKFLGNEPCALILGDNVFFGSGLKKLLQNAVNSADKGSATIFAYSVKDPWRFGIVEMDSSNKAISLTEKPNKGEEKSNYAVTGLYFYPRGVSQKAKRVQKSSRGEYEITSLNSMYLDENNLSVQTLGRGYSWLDTGTMESLLDASNFIKMVEDHQALKICCPEEIAFSNGWITKENLLQSAELLGKSEYGEYLKTVANGNIIY